MEFYTIQQVRESVQALWEKLNGFQPQVLLILGSGLGALADEMEKSAIDPEHQTVFISHGDCLADAEFVAEEIRRRFGTRDIHINYVGPVIGSHSGPGTVALFFTGSPR